MTGLESLGSWAMAMDDGPFSEFGRCVDVGGDHGHFLFKVLQLSPNKQGILHDLDHMMLNAGKLWEEPSGPCFAEKNATLVSGDFLHCTRTIRAARIVFCMPGPQPNVWWAGKPECRQDLNWSSKIKQSDFESCQRTSWRRLFGSPQVQMHDKRTFKAMRFDEQLLSEWFSGAG
jgi:hypothetical protein